MSARRSFPSLPSEAELEDEFRLLVAQWTNETALTSSLTRMVMHPAYQRIIGMGTPALPLILRQLRDEPDHWFWALRAIAGEDPANGEPDFDAAAAAWIAWGQERGYI